MNKTTLESTFEKDSNKIFKNNTDSYTDNDKEFLSKLAELYGNTLSAKGLNVVDPIYANMFHYNKTQFRGNVDHPRVNRTYVFFTRPELNFSFENINAIPFFKWLYNKRIGKMVMAALTDPDYFIYAPGALNSISQLTFQEIANIMKEYSKAMKEQEQQINTAFGKSDPDYKEFNDNSEDYAKLIDESLAVEALANEDEDAASDDSDERAKLEGLKIDSMYDETMFETLITEANDISKVYQDVYSKYDSMTGLLDSLTVYGHSSQKIENLTNGCMLAKDILKTTHNAPGDTFQYTTPFIPLLQNTCTQLTGAKDWQLETHEYEKDKFGQTQVVATGMDEIFNGGTFTTNHEDILYSPVSLLYMVWILYIHYVSRGYIVTTREHITERILDYTCSAYVFTIGDDGKRIERFGKYTGCFPTSFPLSSQLEHNSNVDPDILQKISVSWRYNKYESMDPQIFTDFNFLSESEWLVKLKPAFWEQLYQRHGGITTEMIASFLDPSSAKNDAELARLEQIGRPKELWEMIPASKRGMSGKLPRQLFEAQTSISPINFVNNHWGGYPYIVNGTDLLWVLPQYDEKQSVRRDKVEKSDGSGWAGENNTTTIDDKSQEKYSNNVSQTQAPALGASAENPVPLGSLPEIQLNGTYVGLATDLKALNSNNALV